MPRYQIVCIKQSSEESQADKFIIINGGLIIGGQYGEGALRVNGKTTGYFNTGAASWGLQAGA